MKDVNDLFGDLKKGPLKDVFESLAGKPKPKPKDEEPKWPTVKINSNK
jgi:hypothetical protein